MTLKRKGVFILLSWCLVILFSTSVTWAAVDNVRCVLWQGDADSYHTSISKPGSEDPVDPMSVWNTTGDNEIQVVYSGGGYVSWIRAIVTGGTSAGTYCVYDVAGGTGNCSGDNLCNEGYDGAAFNQSVTISAGTQPDSITFEMLETQCNLGGEYEVFLNGTSLGFMSNDPALSCSCTPGINTATPDPDAGSGENYETLLKGVITTTNTNSIWYKWVFGDGTESSVQELNGATKYNVEEVHTYTGAAVGTPFTAMLMVDDVDSSMANARSDTYLLKIEEDNLDSRINIAIDTGLWTLYKNAVFSDGATAPYLTYNSQPVAVWNYSSYYASPTASAIQAFMINNHKETGNASEDPYVEPVAQGLNWLFNGHYNNSPMLQAMDIEIQHYDNPDTNGNGIGIEVRDWGYNPAYQGGMIMDAIIATGTPNATTGRDFDGVGGPDTYKQVLQDMADMYAYGQQDTNVGDVDTDGDDDMRGGWRYSWHQAGDNSACQWAAIGMIPAQQAPWNCTVPDWVKEYNNIWLDYSYQDINADHGGFGYTTPGYGDALTPSGMVQLAFVGAETSETRWVKTERWLADSWTTWINSGNMYAYYAATKAMRLALPSAIETFSSNGFNWYRGDTTTNGMARQLVDTQGENGQWSGYWTSGSLPTAWAVIILKPALFKAAPYACYTAHPNPNYPDQPVNFDPTCSGHTETGKNIDNLISFEWDWNNDGTYDESTVDPSVVTRSFACTSLPCTYPVTLKVTDDNDPVLTATYTLDIVISNPPHPPVADAGGPYVVSLCDGDTLTLDGSGSFDPNDGEHEDGCAACPDDEITSWDWDFFGSPFNYADGSGETVVAGYTTVGTYDVGLKVTDNTALAYLNSGSANLTDENFTTATVYPACACDIAAETGCLSVVLTWTEDGTYELMRSETGPNSGFVKIADVTGTEFTDDTVETDKTYFYRLMGDDCMSNVAEIHYVEDQDLCDTPDLPVCIDDLVAKAKTRKVQLEWECHADADCYNVYRSTSPNVEIIPGNKIADCHISTYCAFTDRSVTNGITYYYRITQVIGGQEECQSIEVDATPMARVR